MFNKILLFLPILFLIRYVKSKIGYLIFVVCLFDFLILIFGNYDITFPVFLVLLIINFYPKRFNVFSIIFLSFKDSISKKLTSSIFGAVGKSSGFIPTIWNKTFI